MCSLFVAILDWKEFHDAPAMCLVHRCIYGMCTQLATKCLYIHCIIIILLVVVPWW